VGIEVEKGKVLHLLNVAGELGRKDDVLPNTPVELSRNIDP